MKKRWLCVATVACLLCGLLTGCQNDAPQEDEKMEIGTDVKLIHVDLETVFSLEEISNTVGVTVTDNNVFETETSVSYQDENGSTVAIVAFQSVAKDIFDEMVASYDDTEETPNLGQVAIWSKAGELLVYESGYAISVHVAVSDMTDSERLTASRQLAALLLERAFE